MTAYPREAALALAICALCAGLAGAASVVQAEEPEPDSVLLRADVQPDGTASWTVEHRIRLDDENATEAFEALRREIENDTAAYREQFADRMRPAVAAAANETGREMELCNVTVTTRRDQLPQEYGVVVYRFEWTGFAAVDGDHLVAGDALAGLFLEDGSALVLGWPPDYQVVDVGPPPDDHQDRAVVWFGPADFGPGEPRVVAAPAETPTAASDGGSVADGVAGALQRVGLRGIVFPAVSLAAVALLAAATVLVYRARRAEAPGSADGAAGQGPPDGPDTDTPMDLLSNEERVLALLADRGGRLRQQHVAEELGWSEAKTSQVVSRLRENGEVDVFRKGRENVLVRPTEDDT